MDNQKIENQLNLAIEVSPEERRKTMDLNVGFDSEDDTWQVIVKFFGTEEELQSVFADAFPEKYMEIKIQNLTGKYAILKVPEELVEEVAGLPQIEYMEKPKRLFFAVNNGKSVSCINPLQVWSGMAEQPGGPPEVYNGRNNLTGKGVITALIDSGERVIIMSS